MAIKRTKKVCKGCNTPQYIFSKGLCKVCKAKQSKKKVYKRKPSGELKLFKEIAQERDWICENCKDPIHEITVSNMAHVKAKGRFPELRLDKENIRIWCVTCHYEWDHGLKSRFQARTK